MDDKLARGYSRQVGRKWQTAGRGVRAANFMFAQELVSGLPGHGKIAEPAFNVALTRHMNAAGDLSATPVRRHTRAKMGAAGGMLAYSLIARDVLHLRGNCSHFSLPEWTFALDQVLCDHGRISMEFSTPPVIAEQHLVERWVQRTGRTDAGGLAEAASAALPVALLYLAVARSGRGVRAMDIAIPAAGGAFLGGVELVVAKDVEEGFRCDWRQKTVGKKFAGLSFCTPPGGVDLLAVASLRTFVDGDLLSTEQQRHLGRLQAWMNEHRSALDVIGASGRNPDADSPEVRDFAPLADVAQEQFVSWRRRLQEQGFDSLDFSALRADWRRHNTDISSRAAAKERIAAIGCVQPDAVTIMNQMSLTSFEKKPIPGGGSTVIARAIKSIPAGAMHVPGALQPALAAPAMWF
jgi:hypothetical protein